MPTPPPPSSATLSPQATAAENITLRKLSDGSFAITDPNSNILTIAATGSPNNRQLKCSNGKVITLEVPELDAILASLGTVAAVPIGIDGSARRYPMGKPGLLSDRCDKGASR